VEAQDPAADVDAECSRAPDGCPRLEGFLVRKSWVSRNRGWVSRNRGRVSRIAQESVGVQDRVGLEHRKER
jgi:hypothetical protein